MDLKSILTSSGMFGLLIFSILAFAITVQEDAGIPNKITDNDIINETYENLQISFSSQDAESASDNFGRTTPNAQFGELELTSILSPTKVVREFTIGLWNIYIKLPMSVLGVNPLVASLISSIFLILIIIAMWAVWKGAIS